ncbi:MAG: type I restriction enzyme HsdR N-terminal domain-containing protein [Desulfovibrio sp.]|jgi:hypothetical protein|nr:type I restriction enzyme HsdR N-terminal domain-containing protein [Desulfovibrio sp.]
MHEVSLGGVIRDYLSGEERELTTYEDLRQALARFLVEERGYAASSLRPHYPVAYEVDGEIMVREADIAMFLGDGRLGLLLVFCAGQINTYKREAVALARLALPDPAPLALVTDTRAAELFAVRDGATLARGLEALPGQAGMEALAQARPAPPLTAERRLRESRILHAYTGFLKTCCGERCDI